MAAVAAPVEAQVEEDSGEEAPPMMLAADEEAVESATVQEESAAVSKTGLPGAAQTPEMTAAISEEEDVSLPAVPSGEGAPALAVVVEDDDGFGLPLWQLEVIFGGVSAVLVLGTLWAAYRRRHQSA